MNPLIYLLTLSLAFASMLFAAPSQPNIIYILADDAGIGDFGCYGNKVIKTPHIDQLAGSGMRFLNAYSGSAVCAPTRNVLMTGRHTGHCLFRANKNLSIPADTITVAEMLKNRGYATGGFGKWGLGLQGTPGAPENQGFDVFFGYYDQVHAHSYFTDHLLRNGKIEKQTEKSYSHDVIEAEALKFIESHAKEPFFLYGTFTLPHAKFEIPERDPAYLAYAGAGMSEKDRVYAAMVTRLDATVGKMVDLVNRLGLAENTVFFSSSDNGGRGPESAGGLRGIKRSLYEGGIRTPQVICWPGKIKPGTTSEVLTGHVDFFSTAAALSGSEPSQDDGVSLLPVLLGKESPELHEHLYWEIYENFFQQAIRSGKWKAYRTGLKAPMELYDLTEDPGEKTNVAAKYPELIAKFSALMEREHVASPHWKAPDQKGEKRKNSKKTEE